MHRKDWMPPRGRAIGKSLAPSQPTGRTAERRRKAKRTTTLLVSAAALTLILLGAVLLSGGDGNETAQPPEVPAGTFAPPAPYVVFGYTYNADGITPLPFCDVTITDVTSAGVWTCASGADGKYTYVIEAAEGDTLRAEAVNGELYGMTEGVAVGGAIQLNIVLSSAEIPELPMVLGPVLGILALVTVAVIWRRRSIQQ